VSVDRGARAAALAWAADDVAVRGEVLEALRDGRTDLAGVLARAATDEHVGRIRVLKVVEAVPGMGKVACRRLLAGLGVDETTPLTEIDAPALVEAVEGVEP
jgi:hypothetical protein